jgi:gmma-aminobutyric acid receptor subunit gamma/cGMP-dependent protein kinase 2
MAHINTIIPHTLGPLQFKYHPNRSTDDAISNTLHTALSHLDKRNTYVRMLFIDYSSTFNTIVPSKLITKLGTEHLPLQLDPALPDRPPPGGEDRQQHIRHTDRHHGGPSGLRAYLPHVLPVHPKLWPRTTPTPSLSLLDDDETAYREEVSGLAVWFQDNNLSLNVSKTKELIVDYRACPHPHRRGCSGASISSGSTSLRNYHGPHTPTQS